MSIPTADSIDFELPTLPASAPNNAFVVVGGVAYVGDGTNWNEIGNAASAHTDRPVCRAYHNATQSIPTGVATPVIFNTEVTDPAGMHSTALNTSRFVAPYNGSYLFAGGVSWQDDVQANLIGVNIRKNGTEVLKSSISRGSATASTNRADAIADVVELLAGEYVELLAYQNTGGARNIRAGTVANQDNASASLKYLGPSSTNPARRVKGIVNLVGVANGASAGSGPGWSAIKNSTGVCTIAWTPAFAAVPTVQGTAVSGILRHHLNPSARVPGSTQLNVISDAGALVDSAFDFTAEDPGLGLEATMDVMPATDIPLNATNWAQPNDGTPNGKYRKTPDGKVHLEGRVRSITGITFSAATSVIGTLPLGFRPAIGKSRSFICFSMDGDGSTEAVRVVVRDTGTITVENGIAGNSHGGGVNTRVDLDPISFFID